MNKKITTSQLRTIVEDYHRLLTDWLHVTAETLARVDGPVLQGIGFQVLSWGDYRPTNYIQVLVAPSSGRRGRVDFFPQMPRGSPRTSSLRGHEKLRDQMFETMKREFTPTITEPLHARKVLDLCEQVAIPKSGEAFALAALNSYFGHDDRAKYWCSRFPELVDALGRPWEKWHYQEKAFLDELERWLDAGEAKHHLERIREQELAKWGIN